VALEKQYPGELNADSKKVSIQVKPGVTTYLRLESQFGHVHFVFREVPIDIGAAESAKMSPTKSSDSYTAVVPSFPPTSRNSPRIRGDGPAQFSIAVTIRIVSVKACLHQ